LLIDLLGETKRSDFVTNGKNFEIAARPHRVWRSVFYRVIRGRHSEKIQRELRSNRRCKKRIDNYCWLFGLICDMQGKADGYLGQLADYTAIQVFQPAYDGTGGDEPSLRLLRFEHEESLKPWDCVVSSEHILRKYFIIIQFLDP